MNGTINVGVIGPVSSGKSTLINTLFVRQYSDCKMKRTTAVPQIYHTYSDEKKNCINKNADHIRMGNRVRNNEIMNKTAVGCELKSYEITEINYDVLNIHNMLEHVKVGNLSIYDLPGINDSSTKIAYQEYFNKNSHKFDIILLVLDINTALNTSDDIDILKLILTNMSDNKTKYDINTHLIVLLNKCDELVLSDDYYIPRDEELREMYKQSITIITKQASLFTDLPEIHIKSISLEDAFIYRSYEYDNNCVLDDKYMDKFGNNEFGKRVWSNKTKEQQKSCIKTLLASMDHKLSIAKTGFLHFDKILTKVINNNYYSISVNPIKYELSKIYDDVFDIDVYYTLYKRIKKIKRSVDSKDNGFMDTFKDTLKARFDSYRTGVNANLKYVCEQGKGGTNIKFMESDLTPAKYIKRDVSYLCNNIEYFEKSLKKYEYICVIYNNIMNLVNDDADDIEICAIFDSYLNNLYKHQLKSLTIENSYDCVKRLIELNCGELPDEIDIKLKNITIHELNKPSEYTYGHLKTLSDIHPCIEENLLMYLLINLIKQIHKLTINATNPNTDQRNSLCLYILYKFDMNRVSIFKYNAYINIIKEYINGQFTTTRQPNPNVALALIYTVKDINEIDNKHLIDGFFTEYKKFYPN
jgi:GTPase Era involved in 16S rRNA processing